MFNQNKLKRPAASFAAAVGLSLALSACGGGGGITPEPDPDPKPPTEQMGLIKGQITPFKVGDASSVSAGAENDKDQAIATAPVDMDGKFDLGLPKSDVMTASFNNKLVKPSDVFGCTAKETESISAPDNMRLLPIASLKTNKFQSIITEADSKNPIYNYKAWWFSNTDGTFRFKGDCKELAFGSPIDTTLILKKGWNVVDTYLDFGKSQKYAVTSQPTTYLPWKSATASASSLSLNVQSVITSKNFFTPWKNLPQYQNR
ncbi:hypothetical protein [Deinococcus sp. AJ005]|uniref:hypothetical protein n=1 Tax=Deinococcus sp. AJ005 TaxID=2652443 RepID=UPI00125CAF65|nr:hypothetical protein [Deinococcus sp. AJ005]QFP77450.1 hypothetical protein DAAJ005_14005 [Deinococcus sp. AJ005]